MIQKTTIDGVLTLRDTESVKRLKKRLGSCRRVLVVGAGGIGMEVAHEIDGCDVLWVIKATHMGGTFFDDRVAEGIKSFPQSQRLPQSNAGTPNNLIFSEESNGVCTSETMAAAVGPDWLGRREGPVLFDDHGSPQLPDHHAQQLGRLRGAGISRNFDMITSYEVCQLRPDPSGDWPLLADLTDGQTIGCDAIIAGTGVTPNTEWTLDCGVRLGDD